MSKHDSSCLAATRSPKQPSGTGRIALQPVRRGVAVHGIDLSRVMVACLRAKTGGVIIGGFATAWVRWAGSWL
jgi:hypothetical protein